MSQHPHAPDAHIAATMLEVMLGATRDIGKRRSMLGVDALKECSQQFQVAISGQATATAAYAKLKLPFSYVFVIGGAQRSSDLIVPHFTWGYHISTPDPVAVTAMVSGWDMDANYSVAGADITWGAWAPDQPNQPIAFNGVLHLNIQGWGSPPEVDSYTMWDDPGSVGPAGG